MPRAPMEKIYNNLCATLHVRQSVQQSRVIHHWLRKEAMQGPPASTFPLAGWYESAPTRKRATTPERPLLRSEQCLLAPQLTDERKVHE